MDKVGILGSTIGNFNLHLLATASGISGNELRRRLGYAVARFCIRLKNFFGY